jgi:hypothetical protein
LENLKGRDHSEDLSVDGKTIQELILRKQGGKVWNRCIWLRIGTSGGSCEHSNEPTGFMWGVGEFFTKQITISFSRSTLLHDVKELITFTEVVKTSNYISGTSQSRQQCSGYIFLITNFKPEDGGSTASKMLVSNHQTTLCNNPENQDFYFSTVKP